MFIKPVLEPRNKTEAGSSERKTMKISNVVMTTWYFTAYAVQ